MINIRKTVFKITQVLSLQVKDKTQEYDLRLPGDGRRIKCKPIPRIVTVAFKFLIAPGNSGDFG